jgi:hypothetical protein
LLEQEDLLEQVTLMAVVVELDRIARLDHL